MFWRWSPHSSISTNSESLSRWNFPLGSQSSSVRCVVIWAKPDFGPQQNNHLFALSPPPPRHPRLPHHHSNSHLPGVPLQWVWRIHFRHPRRIQGRPQSLPGPLMWPAFCQHFKGGGAETGTESDQLLTFLFCKLFCVCSSLRFVHKRDIKSLDRFSFRCR